MTRLDEIRQRAEQVTAWEGQPKVVGSWFAEAKAFARDVPYLLGELAKAEAVLRQITRTPSRDWHMNAEIARAYFAAQEPS